jgi:hypothetical protein
VNFHSLKNAEMVIDHATALLTTIDEILLNARIFDASHAQLLVMKDQIKGYCKDALTFMP